MNQPTSTGSFEFKGKIRHPRLYADYYYDRWTPCSVFESKWESGGEELCGETWPQQGVSIVTPIYAFEGEWRHVKQTKTETSTPVTMNQSSTSPAYSEGFSAGLNGENADECPYISHCLLESARGWLSGYTQGISQRLENEIAARLTHEKSHQKRA